MKKGFFFLKKKSNQCDFFQKKKFSEEAQERERVNKHSERQTWGEETWKEKTREKLGE